MAKQRLALLYSNTFSDAIGQVHGLTPQEFDVALAATLPIVSRIEEERAGGQHRYRDLPKDASMLREVSAAVKRYAGRFDNLVVLGIGGSALGNIALQSALNPPYYNLLPKSRRPGPRLFVVDNVDPVQFGTLLDLLGPELRRTLFNVISKSGETAETASQFLIVRDMLHKKLGPRGLLKNMIVTTDAKSGTMREIVDAAGFDNLPVPDGVGGRFSVLSAVGLFSAGMCGINLRNLLNGAAEMSARVGQAQKNPAAVLATLLHEFYTRGKRMHVMMPYSHQLYDLADWYRQLWAESLGKNMDVDGRPTNVGPTPLKALGTTDQHSQVQLFREGPNDKVYMFLEVDRFARDVKIPRAAGTRAAQSGAVTLPDELRYLSGQSLQTLLNAEKRATEAALVQSQRPCLTIRFPVIDAYTVGQFIMLWEAATTIAGYLLRINPYDQPAVQLGKEYTFALMGKGGYEKQRRELQAFAKRAESLSV